jgi:hypothetical protein
MLLDLSFNAIKLIPLAGILFVGAHGSKLSMPVTRILTLGNTRLAA